MPNAIAPWNPVVPVRNDITEVSGELVDQRLADVEAVARWMDYAFELPGGYRFGFAGLIGLIPGIGDIIDAIISLYIVNRAIQLGIPRIAIARMMLNVGIEGLLGATPFIGDLFDIVFKANKRNYELLKSHLAHPRAQHRSDWLFLLGTLLIAGAAVALPIWLLAQLLHHL